MTYDDLVAIARSDQEIVGLVLTGSRGRGCAVTDGADWDVRLIVTDDVRDEYRSRFSTSHGSTVEVVVLSASEFAAAGEIGSDSAWDRYSYVGANVVVDDPAGSIARHVAQKSVLPPDEARPLAAERLDDYVNSYYRAAKNLRAGLELEARLDAAESVPALLDFLFAVHDRVRPFNRFLSWELTRSPLPGAEWSVGRLLPRLQAIAAGDLAEQQRTFRDVEALARSHGLDDVIDGWEPDVAWLRGDWLPRGLHWNGMARTYKTEAVVLRSFRFGEADRILHLYSLDRGRVGAMAKGVRKTKSRFGARLEPFSHVELLLHQGSGELHTVTGASLVDAHRATREDPYRLSVGLVGAEAMLRLYVEEERNERAFEALTRFLEAVDAVPAGRRGQAALDPLALAFQLKLLWLSGYVPHLESCVECGGVDGLVGYLPRAGGAVCSPCAPDETVFVSPEGFRGMHALIWSPLADAHDLGVGERALRDTLAVVVASYEFHGGFRLRTLTA